MIHSIIRWISFEIQSHKFTRLLLKESVFFCLMSKTLVIMIVPNSAGQSVLMTAPGKEIF